MTAEEWERVVEALKKGEGFAAERDAVVLELMVRTGIRVVCEIALGVEDLDLDLGELQLQ